MPWWGFPGGTAVAKALLTVLGLTKRYGALAANSNIDFSMQEGEVHAVIGPNGAGKTTFMGQLAGEVRPTAGQIVFNGHDVTDLPAHRRAALGLARTFQITSLFSSFSALENVAITAQALSGHSFRFWHSADREDALNRCAAEALAMFGLSEHAAEPCSALSHGQHRQLEMAMAFVNRPALVLLDEPTAGMAREETREVLALLRKLKGRQAILLIEHDMEVVFAIAERITVLVSGTVIASGTPAEVRADPAVRAAYLGESFS
jgi:branched-chain amino acid transport system ATP-binding protein